MVQQSSEPKYGFIDRKGKFVIPPEFAMVWDFDEFGIAQIKTTDERFGLIDTKGKYIWEPTR